MAGSAALGFDGKGHPPVDSILRWKFPGFQPLLDQSLFSIVTKTLTRQPRIGNYRWYNPFSSIRPLWDGLRIVGSVNSVGLTNPGIEWWCEEIGAEIDLSNITVSIFSEKPDDAEYCAELQEMARMLNRFRLEAIELNASCPNTGGDCLKANAERIVDACQRVYETSHSPLILKVSPVHPVEEIVRLLLEKSEREEEMIVEAISINSVPWRIVHPDRKSPLEHLGGGGVSGKPAQPYTWDIVRRIVAAQAGSDMKIPVIGPSVWDYEDMDKLLSLGAEAISLCSAFFIPGRPTQFVRRFAAEHGISLEDLRTRRSRR